MCKRRIHGEQRIATGIAGEKPVHLWRVGRIQRVERHAVRANRNMRGARPAGEKRAIRDTSAGIISVGNIKTRVPENNEIEPIGIPRRVENRDREMQRQ